MWHCGGTVQCVVIGGQMKQCVCGVGWHSVAGVWPPQSTQSVTAVGVGWIGCGIAAGAGPGAGAAALPGLIAALLLIQTYEPPSLESSIGMLCTTSACGTSYQLPSVGSG